MLDTWGTWVSSKAEFLPVMILMHYVEKKGTVDILFLRLLTLSKKYLFIKFAISKVLLIILPFLLNSLGVGKFTILQFRFVWLNH